LDERRDPREAIKIIRTARNITQRALAKQLKVSANYLSLIESDKRIQFGLPERLAAQLGVPVAMLFVFKGACPGFPASDLTSLGRCSLKLIIWSSKNTERSSG